MAMAEKVSISVNGESRVPPGFRFHPTEEELLQYYLRKKVALEKIDLDVIVEVDLNKLEPWDIQERCKIGTTPQNDWYLFSHKDKKYPSGSRTNRATMAGFWKATGRDKIIYGNGSSRIGMRKTLVFYKGRAPHGIKSEWIMHEYRLHDDNAATHTTTSKNLRTETTTTTCQEEGWVVCRIFKKKSRGSSDSVSRASELMSSEEGSLEQIFLQQMGGATPAGLPGLLELNPIISTVHVATSNPASSCHPCDHENNNYTFDATSNDNDNDNSNNSSKSHWAAMDRMLAAHLNGQQQPPDLTPSSSSNYNNHLGAPDCYYSAGSDLWTLINR